jgi:Ca-activated chloride channel family protein
MSRNPICAWLEAPGFRALALALVLSTGASAQTSAQTPVPSTAPKQATPPATTPPAKAPTVPTPPANTTDSQASGLPTGNEAGEFTIKRSVDEVNLIFTVTDKHSGRFVRDLKQSDFALLDDQKAPSKVSKFVQQTNLPLRVGVVIDASTSIRQRFQFEQQSASEFLMQVLRPQSDRAFVLGFDVTPDLKQDWTSNQDLLETGISKLRPGGGTALFDAVYTACHDKLLDTSRGQEPVRKAMILISDGDDNQSRAYLDDAIKMCQRADTIIYAISTNISPSRGRGDEVLMKMSEATGGSTYYPKRMEDMSQSFHDIEDELRSQYALSYTPADFKTDGSFRTIYLVANDRKYNVRARKGYFAPKQ